MMRRINPRHVTETVHVAPYSAEDDWLGTWGAPVDVAAQVEYRREVLLTTETVTAAAVLTLRVPPDLGRDVQNLFPLSSEVSYGATRSWVLVSRPVLRHGALVYLEVTTGDRPPQFGGWVVTAVLHRTAGRDRRGNPTPAVDVDLGRVVIVPGESSEPVDEDQSAVTTAQLVVPADAPIIRSTDSLTVTGSPLAGRWQVEGDPAPHRNRTVVQLRRS